MTGRFENNAAIIDIEVISLLLNGQLKKTLPVTIDTGFTNDLTLTYNEALPLGLTLVGFQDYTIADGSKVTFLECYGIVKLGNQQALTTISIRKSGSLLIGVSLLKKLGCILNIDFVQETVNITQNLTQNPPQPPPANSPPKQSKPTP